MTVLYILGFIAVVVIIFIVTAWVDGFSERTYGYKFFTWGNLALTSIGYFIILYGGKWFLEASTKGGDILNGQILVLLGVMLVSGIFLNHIRNTGLVFGVIVGVYQLLLYIPLSVISALALFVGVAWAMETKPVYNIN